MANVLRPNCQYSPPRVLLKSLNRNSANMSFAFCRRDSDFGYSDDTIAENIYIFEVFYLSVKSLPMP